MKRLTTVVATMGIALMVGGTALPAAAAVDSSGGTTASAVTKQSKIQRSHIWNIKHRDYKVVNTKGKTYTLSGKTNNVKMKANHNLKNYKQSTWTRKKIVQIKQNNNWMMYYYVTTGKKGKISGWVKLTDVNLKHPRKPAKHVAPEFDVYYRKLNQAQRNEYRDFTYGGARTAEGEPSETAF